MAVHLLGDSSRVTVETDAYLNGVRRLDSYLHSTPVDPDGRALGGGNVIAVVGDYGTGKTHLGDRLVSIAAEALGITRQSMYFEVTNDGFLGVYQRLYRQIGLLGVRDRVRDYYRDVVIDDQAANGDTFQVVERLRNGDDPVHIVRALSLPESTLIQTVQEKLQEVTGNEEFGNALTLLLRPGFDDSVGTWLSGAPPDEVLVDRAITRQIDSEVSALEALGALVLLSGRKNHRFVLVLDELDKIISANRAPIQDVMGALQKLFQVFTAAGALLFLIGLPDFIQNLSEGVRQRIGHTIQMSVMNADQLRQFVELSQERAFGSRRLEPFTEDTLDQVASICQGNPRRIIRLCHQLFRAATDAGGVITDQLLWQVVRERFPDTTTNDVHGEVRRQLDLRGLDYRLQASLGPRRQQDFWISLGQGEVHVAVLISRSLHLPVDVDELVSWLSALRATAQSCEPLLIIDDFLAPGLEPEVRGLCSTEPLVYRARSFREDFDALLTSTILRFTPPKGQDPITKLTSWVEKIDRQQSGLYGSIDRLQSQVASARGSSDHRLTVVQQELAQLTAVIQDALGAGTGPHGHPDGLPARVEQVFRRARAPLDQSTDWQAPLAAAFTTDTDEPAAGGDIVSRLRSPSFASAVGVVHILQLLVDDFRQAIVAWYQRAGPVGEPLDDEAGRLLDTLCQSYDYVLEYVPAQPLGSTASYQTELRELLEDLSVQVREAVRSTFPPGAGTS